MRSLHLLSATVFLLSGCAASDPLAVNPDQAKPYGTNLTESQKAFFVASVLNTPTSKLETELTKKLGPLAIFTPSFNIYEMASTAYELVLERPTDMSRWRALAKLDSFDSGVYAPGYQAARTEALRRNPNLFSNCPNFAPWSAQYHQELRSAG